MPYDKAAPGEWQVFDMNARMLDPTTQRTKPRVHESRLGRPWRLTFDEACFMPEEDARVFLKDPAFRVLNADGEEVPSLVAAQLSRKLPDKLDPEMTIAKFDELTTESLLTRAAQRPGGQRFNSTTARRVLVDFLIEGVIRDTKATRSDGVDDESLDNMSPEETARLLQGS